MKKLLAGLSITTLLSIPAFSQKSFGYETKKYIAYNDSITVFTNALLIDGKGNPAKPGQTVVISKGKIDWIGDDAKASIPTGAKIIDLKGQALMPGLVMTHEHMYTSAFSLDPRNLYLKQVPVTFPRMYLAAGATTIRTCGSIEPYSDLSIKREIDAGASPGPFIELTAPYVEGKGSVFAQMNELKTTADATAFVNYWADQGFTSFKAYMALGKPELKAAIEAAHKRHLKFTGHLCAVTYKEAADLGIDQLEHGFFENSGFVKNKKENECVDATLTLAKIDVAGDSVKALLQFLIDKKTAVTSTLAVLEGSTSAQPAPSAELLAMYSPDNRDFYLKLFAMTKSFSNGDFDKAYANNAKMEKLFYDMGGLLTVGTDPTGNGGTIAGFGTWRAIELLVKSDGFTPLEAIKIATLNGAIALGFDKTTGTIEVGKYADVLIIDGDPSRNIHDIRKVQYVFKKGVGYDSKKLFESVKGRVGFN
ncbi:amidohydrolase family protein [soil metagenome]